MSVTRSVLPKISSKLSEEKTFGIEFQGNRFNFINLFGPNNKVVQDGDECYFLCFNSLDFHRPLVAKGRVLSKDYYKGLNIVYQIEFINFVESEQTLYDYVAVDNQFITLDWEKVQEAKNKKFDKVLSNAAHIKTVVFHSLRDINNYEKDTTIDRIYFHTQAFMVRHSYEEIMKVKRDYAIFCRKELLYQVRELDRIINGDEINDKGEHEEFVNI